MQSKFENTQLSSLLGELWRQPQEKTQLVQQMIANLDDADWLILVGWDVAATFGPSSGHVSLVRPQNIQITDMWGKLLLEAMLTDLDKDDNNRLQLIQYTASSKVVTLNESSPNIPNLSAGSLSHDPKNLLIAMQLIRYHLDSALLKPPDLRNAQIGLLAASADLDEDRFRRLASWFYSIEVYM
jgi:hypothetical protein